MKPNVKVTETDITHNRVKTDYVVLGAVSGPLFKPVNLVNEIKPIKWYQFWRYHLIGTYNERNRQLQNQFESIFS